jgi:tetratricopeptide (TPR) repeat protein
LKNYPAAIECTNNCNDLLLKYQNKSMAVQNYENLSWYYLFTKEHTKSEQSAREVLKLDSTSLIAKTNLAHALLFQNRFSEAEKIYKELLNTQTILDNFNEFEKAEVISKEHKTDMEKIRKTIKKLK